MAVVGGSDVLQAPSAVEQAAIAVTVNEEESLWTPYSSGAGSRIEGRVAPSPDRDVNRDEPVLAARSRLLADDPFPLGPPEASSKGRQVEPGKKRRFESQTFRHHAQSRNARFGRHPALVRPNESGR